MKLPLRTTARLWLVIPLLAFAFAAWEQATRINEITAISAQTGWSVDSPSIDSKSLTGYRDNQRQLILPEWSHDSYEWVAQVQQSAAAETLQIKHVDFDNAPMGRATRWPVLYRAWISIPGWLHAQFNPLPRGVNIESAGLLSDPILQLATSALATIFIGIEFGSLSAALFIIFSFGLYPFAATFVAGELAPFGLVLIFVLASLLCLAAALRRIAGLKSPQNQGGESFPVFAPPSLIRIYFASAGIFNGLVFWLDPGTAMAVVLATAAGALACAGFAREANVTLQKIHWSTWALAGALTSLLGWIVDGHRADFALPTSENHPLFALAWLGFGAVISTVDTWLRKGDRINRRRSIVSLGLGTMGILVPAIILIAHHQSVVFWDEADYTRLTGLNGELFADSVAAWITRDGLSSPVLATFLPLVTLLIVMLLALRVQKTRILLRPMIFIIGVTAPLTAIAFFQLRFWSVVDVAVLIAVVVVATSRGTDDRRGFRWALILSTVAVLPGVVLGLPSRSGKEGAAFTPSEWRTMISRDLAHWLAARDPRSIIYASPAVSTSLSYYGGLRAVASLSTENRKGFDAMNRIADASTSEEAEQLIQQRSVTYLVFPSWDNFFAHSSLSNRAASSRHFINQLFQWRLPNWLRPVPYFLPKIEGAEPNHVVVLEVVPEQDEPTAAAALAEYFLENGEFDQALELRKALMQYPTDLSALMCLQDIALAAKDSSAFKESSQAILETVQAGTDESISIELSARLTLALARIGKDQLAQKQLERCAAQFTAADVRALSTRTLLRFSVLLSEYHYSLQDAKARELAVRLVPPGSRPGW